MKKLEDFWIHHLTDESNKYSSNDLFIPAVRIAAAMLYPKPGISKVVDAKEGARDLGNL